MKVRDWQFLVEHNNPYYCYKAEKIAYILDCDPDWEPSELDEEGIRQQEVILLFAVPRIEFDLHTPLEMVKKLTTERPHASYDDQQDTCGWLFNDPKNARLVKIPPTDITEVANQFQAFMDNQQDLYTVIQNLLKDNQQPAHRKAAEEILKQLR